MNNELSVTLSNGFTVELFEHDGKLVVGLVNANGYYVSDRPLNDVEVNKLNKIVSSIVTD